MLTKVVTFRINLAEIENFSRCSPRVRPGLVKIEWETAMKSECIAMVTGVSRRLGRASAIDRALQGTHFAVNCSIHEEDANEVVREFENLGTARLGVPRECGGSWTPRATSKWLKKRQKYCGPACGSILQEMDGHQLSKCLDKPRVSAAET